jgi:hypothetical protein
MAMAIYDPLYLLKAPNECTVVIMIFTHKFKRFSGIKNYLIQNENLIEHPFKMWFDIVTACA